MFTKIGAEFRCIRKDKVRILMFTKIRAEFQRKKG